MFAITPKQTIFRLFFNFIRFFSRFLLKEQNPEVCHQGCSHEFFVVVHLYIIHVTSWVYSYSSIYKQLAGEHCFWGLKPQLMHWLYVSILHTVSSTLYIYGWPCAVRRGVQRVIGRLASIQKGQLASPLPEQSN